MSSICLIPLSARTVYVGGVILLHALLFGSMRCLILQLLLIICLGCCLGFLQMVHHTRAVWRNPKQHLGPFHLGTLLSTFQLSLSRSHSLNFVSLFLFYYFATNTPVPSSFSLICHVLCRAYSVALRFKNQVQPSPYFTIPVCCHVLKFDNKKLYLEISQETPFTHCNALVVDNLLSIFLAVQNSSKGDLVTDSLTH